MARGVGLERLPSRRRSSVCGGRAQAESPECTPASSTCSITPAIRTSPVAVAHGVHVDLDGVLEEPVDEHGALGRGRPLAGQATPAELARRHAPGARRRRRSPWPGPRARSSDGRAPGSRPCCATVERLVAPSLRCHPAAGGCRGARTGAFHRSRSSARSIEAGLVPRTSSGARLWASLSGVWPPRLTITPATGAPPGPEPAATSASMTLATSSAVRGSK